MNKFTCHSQVKFSVFDFTLKEPDFQKIFAHKSKY